MNKQKFEMIRLADSIKQVLPAVVKEWNAVKLPLFESLVEQSFADYFKKRLTQEKTKMLAPILDNIFARHMKAVVHNFVVSEGKGQDYSYGSIPMESKITFGIGDSWTGNGYNKTPWHLLMRFELTEHGKIINHFVMITDLSECSSQWTAPGKNSNFSTLKFKIDDLDKLITVIGQVSEKTRTGRKSTYVTTLMESV
jgi:hypothetical protein